MRTLTLDCACDSHIHPAPDCIDRIGNDLEIAKRAYESGMKAIVYKNVFEPTASRAWHTMQSYPGIQVLGGVVLDHFVGGLNPSAVEAAISLGAKFVWLPVFHALGHERAFGQIGSFGYVDNETNGQTLPAITILDANGELSKTVRDIVALCKDHNVILSTGHITSEETLKLAQYAKKENFSKILVNHPFFKVPSMSLDIVQELSSLGAYIEFCSTEICPIPGGGDLQNYVKAVERCDTQKLLIASDAGHNRMGWPDEALRVFAQQIAYSGVPLTTVELMLKDNYYRLLEI